MERYTVKISPLPLLFHFFSLLKTTRINSFNCKSYCLYHPVIPTRDHGHLYPTDPSFDAQIQVLRPT